jgi:hypothetical protein
MLHLEDKRNRKFFPYVSVIAKVRHERPLEQSVNNIKVFYLPTDAQENCFKKNIKIYIKTASTCFGAITIIGEHIFELAKVTVVKTIKIHWCVYFGGVAAYIVRFLFLKFKRCALLLDRSARHLLCRPLI